MNNDGYPDPTMAIKYPKDFFGHPQGNTLSDINITREETHQKMNPKQQVFLSGRSCLSQLLEHHNNILEELEKSNNIDVIYLDFAKVFDKFDHSILLNKLKKM